jgi:hypothetical protein
MVARMKMTPGDNLFGKGRVLVWFSCGAASACAAKLAVEHHANEDVEVLYCDTLAYEHPDNKRFMGDVEKWIGHPIKILSGRHRDIFEVFHAMRFIVGPHGAPCTKILKRQVRKDYEHPEDLHVFGFTADEEQRISDFEDDNPTMRCHWILQERGIAKRDCYRMLMVAGIELPAMYRLGYRNNNCIGCVKGGAGYWNKIRRDFPKAFAKMAALERELHHAIVKVKGEPCYLDSLPEDVGNYRTEPDFECGPQCVYQPSTKELT